MDKRLDNPALIDLPDANGGLCQPLAADIEQLIPRVKIENRHQRLAVMTGGFKARILHHPVDLIAQQRDPPWAVRVKL